MRCPSCDGLRSVSVRRAKEAVRCLDCRRGKVVTREHFYDFWLDCFSVQEIEEMAKALWL